MTDQHSNKKYVVIMAGGSGTRMNSALPKQLLNIGNVPMIVHLLNNSSDMLIDVVLVVSLKNKDTILTTLLKQKYFVEISNNVFKFKNINVIVCVQPVANGTGGALMATKEFFEKTFIDENDSIVVLSADVPLITKQTMIKLFESIDHPSTKVVILGKDTEINYGYGRIVMDRTNGIFIRIVEQKDCTEEEKQITLINTGTYAFKINHLLTSLDKLTSDNSQKEYYLTDCPNHIRNADQNFSSDTIKIIESKITDFDETLGANTPDQLDILKSEYIKKFKIEHIDSSDANLTDKNLKNLVRILEQLSSKKTLTEPDQEKLTIIRNHIKAVSESSINKKHLMIVRYEDEIVGTGSILIENKIIHDMGLVGHIEDIVIDETYRGLGLAKILMERLIDLARFYECYKVILDASDDVKVFYEKLGFRKHANSMRMDIQIKGKL